MLKNDSSIMIASRTGGRFPLYFGISLMILAIFFILNICLGSVPIPPGQVVKVLFGMGSEQATWENIILQFRMPKAITAVLVGSGLGVSGLLMQTLFRNPLAEPFVLGISSGASLGVALTILSGMWLGTILTQAGVGGIWIITFAAFAGAFLVLLLVLAISARVRDSITLLIIGLMMGSATSALVSILQYYSKAESIQAYLIWTFGSLGGVTWDELRIFIPVVIAGIAGSWVLAKPLNALLLGESYAESLGVKVKTIRFYIIMAASVLTGVITAFCGPVAFIGIAVPHLTRMLFHTTNHRVLVPLILITGAILMLACDIVAQLPGQEITFPINAITSIIGAPIVIWIVLRRRDLSTSFS